MMANLTQILKSGESETAEFKENFDNERQVKAIMFIKETGKITNKEYQKITGIKDRIASMELNDLVSKSLLDKVGTTGRGTYYILNKAAKGASKTH